MIYLILIFFGIATKKFGPQIQILTIPYIPIGYIFSTPCKIKSNLYYKVAFKEMTHIHRETLCCNSSEINLNHKFNFVVAKQKVKTIVSIYFHVISIRKWQKKYLLSTLMWKFKVVHISNKNWTWGYIKNLEIFYVILHSTTYFSYCSIDCASKVFLFW